MIGGGAFRAQPVATLLVFVIGLTWGFIFSLIKLGVTGGIAPLGYLFWFPFGAGTVLLALCALRGSLPRLDRAHLRFYATTGAVRIALANAIFYTVQQRVPVGIMAVVMTTVPIFTYAMSLIAGLERFVWLRFAGIVCGFAGVILIVAPQGGLPDPALVFWVLAAFGTPLLHALAYILLSEKNRPPGGNSMTLGVGMLYAAALMVLPVTLAAGAFHPLWPPFTTAERALIAHMVLGGLNFYAIFEAIRLAGPTFMSQANFLSVGFGVAFGMLIFDESHSAFAWMAMALIVVGVALVNARQRQATGS